MIIDGEYMLMDRKNWLIFSIEGIKDEQVGFAKGGREKERESYRSLEELPVETLKC